MKVYCQRYQGALEKCVGLGIWWRPAKQGMNRGKSDHRALYAVCTYVISTHWKKIYEWWMDGMMNG